MSGADKPCAHQAFVAECAAHGALPSSVNRVPLLGVTSNRLAAVLAFTRRSSEVPSKNTAPNRRPPPAAMCAEDWPRT